MIYNTKYIAVFATRSSHENLCDDENPNRCYHGEAEVQAVQLNDLVHT